MLNPTSPRWSSENFSLQKIHSVSLFSSPLDFKSSMAVDTSKRKDSSLLILESFLVGSDLENRSKFNFLTRSFWKFGFSCCFEASRIFFPLLSFNLQPFYYAGFRILLKKIQLSCLCLISRFWWICIFRDVLNTFWLFLQISVCLCVTQTL